MSPLGYIGAVDGPASVFENVTVDASPVGVALSPIPRNMVAPSATAGIVRALRCSLRMFAPSIPGPRLAWPFP
jgi:hypothetical protein